MLKMQVAETIKFGSSLPPGANEPVGAVLTPTKDGPAFFAGAASGVVSLPSAVNFIIVQPDSKACILEIPALPQLYILR